MGYIQKVVGVKVDNDYGTKTTAAVKVWQKKHGLNADGIVGPKTWGKMF
nr:peptidoglycan-binding domain-containing protein [Neobacillus drentensis]